MNITVVREKFTPKSTISKMYIDGKFECYTLEDVVRPSTDPKVYGETAIPKGQYQLTIDYSPKYKRNMCHILNVPGFEGIRIHSGNKAEDTEGCLLVGTAMSEDFISGSKSAYSSFYPKVEKAFEAGDLITITIL